MSVATHSATPNTPVTSAANPTVAAVVMAVLDTTRWTGALLLMKPDDSAVRPVRQTRRSLHGGPTAARAPDQRSRHRPVREGAIATRRQSATASDEIRQSWMPRWTDPSTAGYRNQSSTKRPSPASRRYPPDRSARRCNLGRFLFA